MDGRSSILNKRKLKWILVICLCASGIFYFFSRQEPVQNQRQGAVLPEVETYEIQRADLMRRISLFGQTVAEASVDIAPKYTGRIISVNVKLGQKVAAGDVLLVQDTGDTDLSILQNHAQSRQAEAEAKEAESVYQATYDKVKSNYDLAKTNYERYVALYEQGAVSKEALDQIEQQMVDGKSALDTLLNQSMTGEIPASVEAKLAAYQKALRGTAALEKQRDDLILRAPRSGVIGYRNAEEGAIAQAGQKVFTLVDNSRIYVDCQLTEQDIAAVQAGMNVTVSVESLGNSYPGEIIYVSPAADADTKNYMVRIELTQIDGQLKSGMFGRTAVEVLQRPATLYIPKESLIEKNGKTFVFLVNEDHTVREQSVVVGLRNDEAIEILEGVSEGDAVAVTNLSRLRNEMKITSVDWKSREPL